MLAEELNRKLTQVGPGTPGGELLRRYWHPVAAMAELAGRPTKRVRILGEDLILYRDASGALGLIEERCAHRRISLYYGIPEPTGLRCPYHGWLYDETGQCIEQPAEPEGSTFKDKIKMKAYPVQELGGLVFAYLGPEPVPLLPRYDLFVWPDAVRQIVATVLPCNWLQVMENSLDATHVEWMHGYYSNYVRETEAGQNGGDFRRRQVRHHTKIGFDVFEHGILKRRLEAEGSEDDDDWQIGHAVVFPCILGNPTFQIRVPIDDTHTWHVWYSARRVGVPIEQAPVPFTAMPWLKEDGDIITNFTDGQDIMAWVTQGGVAERQLEKLGQSDVGIIMYRQLLQEQIEKVERGEDPIEVYRDASSNEIVELPRERAQHGRPNEVTWRPDREANRQGGRPTSPEYRQLLEELRVQLAASGVLVEPPEPPVIKVKSLKSVTANLAR